MKYVILTKVLTSKYLPGVARVGACIEPSKITETHKTPFMMLAIPVTAD